MCQHCNEEMEGYQMIINKEKFFMCFTCGKQSDYIPFVNPNRNDRYANILCPDFEGSHNMEYGR